MKRGSKIQIGISVLVIILIWAYINYDNLTNPIIEVQERGIIYIDEPVIEPIIDQSVQDQPKEIPVQPTTLMSDLECVDGKINFILTNIDTKEAKISKFTIMVTSRINLNPDCGTNSLKPGESTQCLNIGGIKSTGNKLVIVRYPPTMSESDIAKC
jgi:hypothetical protein